MGKKNKKGKDGGGNVLKDIGGGAVGAALAQVATDWLESYVAGNASSPFAGLAGGGGGGGGDAAADAFKALHKRGRLTVPELLEESGSNLTALLRSLQLARQFRLVEFVEDDGVVTLTEAGEQAARVLAKGGIKAKAAKLLKGGKKDKKEERRHDADEDDGDE